MAGMLRGIMLGCVLGSGLVLGACTTTAPRTQVTRFHLGQPLAPGQVTIEALPAQPLLGESIEFRTYAAAVGAELARLGYTVTPGLATSEMVASIGVMRGTRETMQRSPLSIGLGGGSFGGSTGVGGGVSFPIGGGAKNLVVTQLVVQLKRRSEGSVVWEGRAQTAAKEGTPYADPAQAVAKLSQALFAGFPGESGRTIEVQ
jgi:hypothetical protein